jgi:hypothetical protein
MIFVIESATLGKVITLGPSNNTFVHDWTTRRKLSFQECLLSSKVVKAMIEKNTFLGNSLPQSYALFGGDSGGDRRARYILAIPYSKIEIIN